MPFFFFRLSQLALLTAATQLHAQRENGDLERVVRAFCQ